MSTDNSTWRLLRRGPIDTNVVGVSGPALRCATLSDAAILLEVEALEAEGRLLEAIDVLRSTGAADDVELASTLLRVRHAAFEQFDRNGGPLSWPPRIDDAFPDVDGVPEL